MTVAFKGSGRNAKDPNICPHCHVTIIPQMEWQVQTKDSDNIESVISAWKCSNSECRKIFLCLHKWKESFFEFNRFLNGLPKGPDWPKPITELKSGNKNDAGELYGSNFIKTYLQSLLAENYGLNELAGMGYRKAIEYLVKDWAIQQKPDDKNKIESSWLGAVINDYYSGDLKEILERATWLGNDQAHYNKLFGEFDLNILKELIDLIMVELDQQYKRKHYIETIQKRK